MDDKEFQRWMNVLLEQTRGINTRLDLLNGRVRENEVDIAVLQDRQPDNPHKKLSVGSMVLAAGTAIVEGWHWYSSH